MNKLSILAYSFVFSLFVSCTTREEPVAQVKTYIITEVDSLQGTVSNFVTTLQTNDHERIVHAFNESRKHYKRIEGLIEFYFPGVCKAINGPAIDKVEEDDAKVIDASGFQVVEEMIFQNVDSSATSELLSEAKILQSSITRLRLLIANTELTDSNVFEAIRLQLLRIISLGISGFDSPVQLNSLQEAEWSLEGIEQVAVFYANSNEAEKLKDLLAETKTFLETHPDFNTFNRGEFIIKRINPLSSMLYRIQQELDIPNNVWSSAVNFDKANFFEEGSFNQMFFVPQYAKEQGKATEELGRYLFFDPILSGNQSRSCASCHKPNKGFTDDTRTASSFNSTGALSRNTPGLINTVFQQNQFWDGRVAFIEDQVSQVISNSEEMHGTLPDAVTLLKRSNEYVSLFAGAFPKENEKISDITVQRALAAYVRSLTSLNARFDHYMRGDEKAISAEELQGFNLFMGKAKCGTCHFLPLFNGTTPPLYKETEAEVLGVPSAFAKSKKVDEDGGKYHLFSHSLLRGMFKTPTVRNASLTAPYMHNGVFNHLEEVLDFYNKGGGAGLGFELENQTLPTDKLDLSKEEQLKIIAFMHALTDTTGLTSVPHRLPSFGIQELDKRKIGGTY
jgi:cytochrome c peroxidase